MKMGCKPFDKKRKKRNEMKMHAFIQNINIEIAQTFPLSVETRYF